MGTWAMPGSHNPKPGFSQGFAFVEGPIAANRIPPQRRCALASPAAQPLAGALWVMDPGVHGLPEPRFAL